MNGKIKCCDKEINLQDGKGYVFYFCHECGKKGKGKNAVKAEWEFNKSISNKITIFKDIPKSASEIQKWAVKNMTSLLEQSASFIDKPATKRMIEKNIKYVSRLNLGKVWDTADGQESIIKAIEEAFYYGAILPEMGSIVPFGLTAEFIPKVEAFNFALTTGKNSPFEWTSIECIYSNDKYKQSRINGSFKLEFESIMADRGELIAVAVYGFDKKRKIIVGDVYTKDRLLSKAKRHSRSYKYYLNDLAAVNKLRSEGKLLEKNGREYFVKKIEYIKEGVKKPFDKEIYIDELSNPYEGADQPEMLRKIAGKSFFRPWMAIRNALEMAKEWTDKDIEKTDMDIVDDALDAAKSQVMRHQTSDIKNAEFEEMDGTCGLPRTGLPKTKSESKTESDRL